MQENMLISYYSYAFVCFRSIAEFADEGYLEDCDKQITQVPDNSEHTIDFAKAGKRHKEQEVSTNLSFGKPDFNRYAI